MLSQMQSKMASEQMKSNEMHLFHAPDYQSKLEMGGLTCYLTRRYNWFHRTMIRLVFGWQVDNLK